MVLRTTSKSSVVSHTSLGSVHSIILKEKSKKDFDSAHEIWLKDSGADPGIDLSKTIGYIAFNGCYCPLFKDDSYCIINESGVEIYNI